MDKLIELLREMFAGLWSHAELAGPLLREQYKTQEWAYAGGALGVVIASTIAGVILIRKALGEEDGDVAVPCAVFGIVALTAALITSSRVLYHAVNALTPELSMLKEAM